jgi:hypothetical protein
MTLYGETVLRQRVCRGSGCHAVFCICQHCDRGQCYCSVACRAAARLWKVGWIIATGNGSTGAAKRKRA